MKEKPADCRLYLISPPKIVLDDFVRAFLDACEGGDIACLQLRLKDASDAEILEAAARLTPLCRKYDIAFIMNDRVDLALECGADGVHLGQEDLETTSIADAKKELGERAVVGVSCHASRHLGLEAGDDGADYVAFGAFYPTTSKSMEKLEKWGKPDKDLLSWWQEMVQVPCVAIGGITPENAVPLVAAGADFIAVINAVWNHPEGAKAAVAEFNQAIAKGLELRATAA